jgi:hypothetical protein
MVTAFISYAHRDEAYRNELEIHLAMLKREGLISVWHDRRIVAGSPIEPTIDEQLSNAALVLLLVSPYFLASDYCYDREMTQAVEKHQLGKARVVPIILNPCEWQRAPFGRLRASPPDGRPVTKFPNVHDAYQAIVVDIRAAIDELGVKPETATMSASSVSAQAHPNAPSNSQCKG